MSLYQRLIKKTLRENVIPFTDDRSRSSWRKKILREFGEWAPIETSGPANSTSTTFGYFSGGSPVINGETGQQVTFTYSGLQGVENYPTSITIDQGFGDTFQTDPPPFSQLGVQGYTAKLNPRYKEAQEKYKKEYDEFEEKRDANFQAIKDTLKSFGTSWEEMRASKKGVKKLSDGTVVSIVRTSSNPSPMNWTNNVRVTKMKQSPNASGPITINYNPPNEYYEWVVENAEIQNEVYLEIGEPPEPPMESEYLMPRRTDYRDVNPLLDASQEFAQQVGADYMMNARVQQIAQVMDGENLLPPDLQDILRRARNEPANSGSTAGERDKRKILDFLETPEGQNITPQMFDSLMNIYMRSQTNPFGVDYGNIASTSLKGLVSNPPSQEVAQVDVLKSFTDIVTLPQKTLDKAVDTLIGGIEKTLGKKAESAINVLNYHKEWQKNPTPEPQDLTSSLSKGDYNYLVKMVKDVVSSQPSTATDEILTQMITNALVTHQLKDAEADRPGLRNIFGNLDSARKESGPDGDGAYVVTDKKGNSYVEFRKAYDFDNAFDFAGVGNPLMTFGAIPYGIKKLGPYASFFGTDTMNIVVRVPIRKKNQNESTTWDRTKKHLKGGLTPS